MTKKRKVYLTVENGKATHWEEISIREWDGESVGDREILLLQEKEIIEEKKGIAFVRKLVKVN